MPALGGKFIIPANGDGDAQGFSYLSAIHAVWEDARSGYALMLQGPGVGLLIDKYYLLPPMDRHYNRTDWTMLSNNYSSGSLPRVVIDRIHIDFNIHGPTVAIDPRTTAIEVVRGSADGIWTGGAWPGSGRPSLTGPGSVGPTDNFGLGGNGIDTHTCRYIASEYGTVIFRETGNLETLSVYGARGMDAQEPGRDIGLTASPIGPPTGSADYASTTRPRYALTFAAPNGGYGSAKDVHCAIECEGRVIGIKLDASRTYDMSSLAQEFTMASNIIFPAATSPNRTNGGFISAERLDCFPGASETFRVFIPPDRAPSAGIPLQTSPLTGVAKTEYPATESNIIPRIRVMYMDPIFAAKVSFGGVLNITPDVFTAGVRGSIGLTTLPGALSEDKGFPQNSIRVGSIVYNRTQGEFAEVVAFRTDTNLYDTAIVGDSTGWLITDAYDFYTYSDDMFGGGATGGTFRGCVEGAEHKLITKTGGSLDIRLNDIYGEAAGLYKVGQGVLVHNDAAVVILEMTSTVTGGAWRVGQIVESNPTGGTGARGIIVGFDSTNNSLIVNTIKGADTPTVRPWQAGHPLRPIPSATTPFSPAEDGSTSTDNIAAVVHSGNHPDIAGTNASTVGWVSAVIITAITQPDKATGDLSHVLTLDMSSGNVNAGIEIFPGAIISTRARFRQWWSSNTTAQLSNAKTYAPDFSGAAQVSHGYEARQNEYLGFSSTASPYTPDPSTSSDDLAEVQLRFFSTQLGRRRFGPFAHVKMLNEAGSTPFTEPREIRPEYFDDERIWVTSRGPLVAQDWDSFGASVSSATLDGQFALIGPADEDIT